MNKKFIIVAIAALTAASVFARGPGGPGGHGGFGGPRPGGPAMRGGFRGGPGFHHSGGWGCGGRNFWPGFVGGVVGSVIGSTISTSWNTVPVITTPVVTAPVVATPIVTTPAVPVLPPQTVVVQQPVSYTSTAPNGAVEVHTSPMTINVPGTTPGRTWISGHYVTNGYGARVWVPGHWE